MAWLSSLSPSLRKAQRMSPKKVAQAQPTRPRIWRLGPTMKNTTLSVVNTCTKTMDRQNQKATKRASLALWTQLKRRKTSRQLSLKCYFTMRHSLRSRVLTPRKTSISSLSSQSSPLNNSLKLLVWRQLPRTATQAIFCKVSFSFPLTWVQKRKTAVKRIRCPKL